jgi:ABC-type sugar transport system permease subunit
VGALNAFAEIFAMTDATGGTSVPVTIPFTDTQMTFQSARISGFYLYQVFSASRYGEAAAMSFLLLLIAVSISGLAWVLTRPRTR